jgi:chromosome segregation ATPase
MTCELNEKLALVGREKDLVIDKAKGEIESISGVTKKFERMVEENREMENSVNALVKENQELKDRLKDHAELSKSYHELNGVMENGKRLIAKFEKENKTLRGQLEGHSGRFDDLVRENENLRSTNRDYENNLQSLESEREQFMDTMQKVQDLEILAEENVKLKEKNHELEKICSRVQLECKKNSLLKDNLLKEKGKLNDTLHKTKIHCSELDHDIQDKNSHIHDLNQDLMSIRDQNKELFDKVVTLEEEQFSNNEVLTSRLQSIEKDFFDLNKEKSSLATKLDKKTLKMRMFKKAAQMKNDEASALQDALKLMDCNSKESNREVKKLQASYNYRIRKLEADLVDERLFADSLNSLFKNVETVLGGSSQREGKSRSERVKRTPSPMVVSGGSRGGVGKRSVSGRGRGLGDGKGKGEGGGGKIGVRNSTLARLDKVIGGFEQKLGKLQERFGLDIVRS